MKRGLSILLLLIFLFNVGGYYIVFWGLRFQNDKQLTHRLNSNLYDPAELIEIKIPVALPYPIQKQGFERVDGNFEHNGQFYKLVKHKYDNDTLYVLCIRDHETQQLVNTITDYVQLTQALPGSNTGQEALQFLSKLVKDFCSQDGIILPPQWGFTLLISFEERPDFFAQPALPVHAPPPRV